MILPLLLLAAAARAQTAPSVAGSVVRSKEWVVRRGKKREEEFIGDVRYDAAGTVLTSDWALYRQEPDDWQARGHIAARRTFPEGDVLETRGETARYNQKTQAGTLEPTAGGRVPVLRTPPLGGTDHAEGDRLTWEGESAAVLSGRARGWGPRGEFWASAARLERGPSGKVLTLTGERPVAHNLAGTADAALKADKIVAFDAPRRCIATGRALGWIIAQSSSTDAAHPGAVRCGKGGREGPGPDERVSALLAFRPGDAPAEAERRFWEAESAAFDARACPWGPRIEFWADEADGEETPERRVTLSGGRPVVRKIDMDSSAALKADRIVAYAVSNRLEAAGRVRGWMTFKEEKKRDDKKREERKK